MTEPIPLVAPPDLKADILPQLQAWVNERYAVEIAHARKHWVGNRVEILGRTRSDRIARHNGRTGKVTGFVVRLADDHLFRYAVAFDKGGDALDGLGEDDFFFSGLSDAEATGRPQSAPPPAHDRVEFDCPPPRRSLGFIKLGEVTPTAEEAAVGRLVRVIDATRFPDRNLYLKEGVVRTVFASGGPSEYAVDLPGEPRSVVLRHAEVRFL